VFDTDSKPIRVDNCTTASITPFIEDCVTVAIAIKVRSKVQGGEGDLNEVYTATIKWSFEDDYGILLPGSYYVPTAPSRLLSPQHWAQIVKDNTPLPRGAWCATYDDCIVLQWDQRKFTRRTTPLDVGQTNVATIHTTVGFSRFEAFCAEGGVDDDDPEPVSFDANLATDTEDEQEEPEWIDQEVPHQRDSTMTTDFDLNSPDSSTAPNTVEDEEDVTPQDASAEFLRWHHRLGYVSPKKIHTLASMGILPRRLLDGKIPLCTSCLYGKATRRSWRTKTTNNAVSKVHTGTKPGVRLH
jgi:hypothetical protein